MGNTVKWVTQGTKSLKVRPEACKPALKQTNKKKTALFLPSSSCLATTVHLDQSERQLGTTGAQAWQTGYPGSGVWSQDGGVGVGDGIPAASLRGHLNQDPGAPEVQEAGSMGSWRWRCDAKATAGGPPPRILPDEPQASAQWPSSIRRWPPFLHSI